MKRTAFSVIAYLLLALFAVLYCVPAVREMILSLNSSSLTQIYANLDSFCSFIWGRSLAHIISFNAPDPLRYGLYGLIEAFLAVTLIVAAVDIASTVIYHVSINRRHLFDSRIADERKNLSDIDQPPSSFEQAKSNFGIFANNEPPKVSLGRIIDLSQPSEVDLSPVKGKPSWRIALSIVFWILVLAFLFIRFVWLVGLSFFSSVFAGLFNLPFVSWLMSQLTAFFSTLLSGIYYLPIAMFAGASASWTWGELAEGLIIIVALGALWGLALYIAHLIVHAYRMRKRHKQTLGSYPQAGQPLSMKAKSFLGNADLMNPQADISFIASISPFGENIHKEDRITKLASYIDDIGEYVEEAGRIANPNSAVPVSVVRQPLAEEETAENLTGNVSATMKDIVSIEDTVSKEKAPLKVESFYLPDESVPKVDLSLIDVTSVASLENRLAEEKSILSSPADVIAFDQDGFSYLVKQGKPFEEEDDISDVITAENLDKTAIINRFGEDYFSLLNGLEPFRLTPLDYDQELANIRERQRRQELAEAETILRDSFSKEPFRPYAEPSEKRQPEEKKVSEKQKEEITSPAKASEEKKADISEAAPPVTVQPAAKQTEGIVPDVSTARRIDLASSFRPQPSTAKPAKPIRPLAVKPISEDSGSKVGTAAPAESGLRSKVPLMPYRIPAAAPAKPSVLPMGEAEPAASAKHINEPAGHIAAEGKPHGPISLINPRPISTESSRGLSAYKSQSRPAPVPAAETELSAAETEKDEKPVSHLAEPPARKKAGLRFRKMNRSSESDKPGPIAPKIVSIEDFLGKGKKK